MPIVIWIFLPIWPIAIGIELLVSKLQWRAYVKKHNQEVETWHNNIMLMFELRRNLCEWADKMERELKKKS